MPGHDHPPYAWHMARTSHPATSAPSSATRPLPRRLASDLRGLVGTDHVVTDPDHLLVYESDGLTAYRFTPGAVVLPASTEEVAAIVKRVAATGLPLVPRGAGTGLSGGALAREGAVVVATPRMNRILQVDRENRRARVQPGVVNAHLTEATRAHGLYYAPDPSSQSACTIGGNVAENSGGPHCLKYGVTSRYVTGLTVVLSDGEVVRLGGMGREPASLDLVGAFVGSEGCFGIATEIEVRLLSLPQGVRTLLAIFESLEDAGRAVTRIIGQGLLPAALEIIDQATIQAVEASVFAAGYPADAGAALVVEFDGIEAGLDQDAMRAEESCRAEGAREVRRASHAEERAALWQGRKKAFGAMGRIAPDLLVQDATVPRTRLPEVLGRITEIGRRYDLKLANVFHAGDGNLHPNILFDRRDAGELARVEKASREIMLACVDVGGTITGEHGVGVDKRKYMSLIFGAETLQTMRDVRRVWDGAGILNPGKVLPDPDDEAGPAAGADAPTGGRRARSGPAGALAALVGGDAVLVGEEARPWRVGDKEPLAVVTPRSAAELSRVLSSANREGWRVIPAGVGGWLGDLPLAHGAEAPIVVSTRALTDVVHYEPADLTVTVEAGMSLSALQSLVGAEGQWLPLDPPPDDSGTIGAALATASSGPLATAYGSPRDLALGVGLVAGDGRSMALGGRVVKNVAGFDLVRPAVGCWGILGIITAATLRLYPRPEMDTTLVFENADRSAVDECARQVALGPVTPAALETADPWPPGEMRAAALVRLMGSHQEVAEMERLTRAVAGTAGWRRLDPLQAEAARARTRTLDARAELLIRLTLLPSRLARARDLVARFVTGPGAQRASGVCTVTDVLTGTTRIGVSDLGAHPVELADALSRLREAAEGEGGSVRVSSGPPDLVRLVGAWGSAGSVRALTGGMQKVFDPNGVLPWERFAS